MKIGVLALQGAFIEHEKMLDALNVESVEIRQKHDLALNVDGIIIPGGESTVQGKLLRELDMLDTLQQEINSGLPVFGTCAGLILLARDIYGGESPHLATMDITARRNAYGRQLGSFSAFADFGNNGRIPLTFIRAPYIERIGKAVITLCEVDGKIVAARQDNQLVTAFHPELTDDLTVHKYFIDMIKSKAL
jgi:5'-phosphate synthase pdxT subunit